MGILSVRPSVTTRYGFNARWDRDSGSSPYDSLESLVSYEVTWCHWVRRFPSKEGIKEGYLPALEIAILPLLAHLAWKRLQIDTDLLRIITSTADELAGGTRISKPQNRDFSDFSRFVAATHISRVNGVEITEDRPRQAENEIFSIKRRF